MLLFTEHKQSVSSSMKRYVVTPMTNNSNSEHHVMELEQAGISPVIIMEGKQRITKQIMSKEEFTSPPPFCAGSDYEMKEGNQDLNKIILVKEVFPFSHSAKTVEGKGRETVECYIERPNFNPKIFKLNQSYIHSNPFS